MEKLLNLPVLASEHGAAVDQLMGYFHALMFALFVGWFAFFVYVLLRFRKSRQPRADAQGVRSHFSSYLEVGVAVVEAVLLLFFAIPGWAMVVEKFPAEKDATVIRVIGQQFAWNARYAGADGQFGKQDLALSTKSNPLGFDTEDPAGKDDVLVLNQIYVPVNRPVIAHISSLDVIHSFKIPAMRVTQDAIPGMSVPLHFKPTRIGSYTITCAQLCGNGHYAMKGQLNVVSQEDFDKWLASRPKSGDSATGYE